MKALSIKQPWAWLICVGYKNVENREWPLPRSMIGQRVYVHAGKKVDDEGAIWLWENKEGLGIQGIVDQWCEICNSWDAGAIIGEVSISGRYGIGHVRMTLGSPWFTGPYGFILANPVLYDKPIPYRGQLGFFEVNIPKPVEVKR